MNDYEGLTDRRCELCLDKFYTIKAIRRVRRLEVCAGCENAAWLGVNPIVAYWPNEEAREIYMREGQAGWKGLVEKAKEEWQKREEG